MPAKINVPSSLSKVLRTKKPLTIHCWRVGRNKRSFVVKPSECMQYLYPVK